MKYLSKLFTRLWFKLFPKLAVNNVNGKLQKAIVNKKESQIKLLLEIRDYMFKVLKIDLGSKFIPLSIRNEACKKVNAEFGKRMIENRIKININLELIKL